MYNLLFNIKIYSALKKKCVSNGLIFNTTDEFSTVNPEQLLNPTLVKPANVPKFNRSQEYIRFQDYEHSYNKSSNHYIPFIFPIFFQIKNKIIIQKVWKIPIYQLMMMNQ